MVPSMSKAKKKKKISLLSKNSFRSNPKPFCIAFQYHTQDYKSNNQIPRQNWTGNNKSHPRKKSVTEGDESKNNHGKIHTPWAT